MEEYTTNFRELDEIRKSKGNEDLIRLFYKK